MKRDDLIQFCRYYKGETENPFNGKEQDRAMLWLCEMHWVMKILDILSDTKQEKEHSIFSTLAEYIGLGLSTFEQYDGVPIMLKAIIFNRFCKYNDRTDIEAFKRFYTEIYKNGA